MRGEESGGGADPRCQRPPPWAVNILVGTIAVPIYCVGIPLLVASRIKNHFFVSKAETEQRMRDQAHTLNAKHKKEVQKLIYYLEKEIKAGYRAKDMILNQEIENEMSLKTIQIIFKEKAEEFGDAVLHEKQLRDQMQKEIAHLNKELEQVQHAREEASLFLCELQSENEALKDEKEKKFSKLNENLKEVSRQLETEKYKTKVAECKLKKNGGAFM